MEDYSKITENGYIGQFAGYLIGGRTYDINMVEIKDAPPHEEDCFCCRKNLLRPKKKE
jgi:hypothetical protein